MYVPIASSLFLKTSPNSATYNMGNTVTGNYVSMHSLYMTPNYHTSNSHESTGVNGDDL